MAWTQMTTFLLLSAVVNIGFSHGHVERAAVPGSLEEVTYELFRLRRETPSKTNTNKQGFTSAEKKTIVDKHNEYRRIPSSADMLYMTWDTELEQMAQSHANKCKWGHNRDRNIPSSGQLAGENLYAKTPSYNEEKAMKSWYDEVGDYSYSSNSCNTGKACGHYTQVVWAKSDRVGCGIRYCRKADGLDWTDVYIIVCNYSPAGNVRGSKPYIKGTSCSKCPAGKKTCDNGLCRDGSNIEVTTAKQTVTTRKPSQTTTRKPTTTTRSTTQLTTTERNSGVATTTTARTVKSGVSTTSSSTLFYIIVMLLLIIFKLI